MKFPRSHRISRRADFQRVRREGESISGRFLVLGYLPDPGLDVPFKIGLITTRKIGNAVTRNRVRRRIRGLLQRSGDQIHPPHWLVFIARRHASNADSAQLEKEWRWLLRKAKIWRESGEKSEPEVGRPVA
ncbi:MAG: ribonuclease P protein component [Verrucomicrobiota bacterium]